jgi:hypothetical protein
MKFCVLKCINGNYSIDAEVGDMNAAKVSYHGLCQSLWNASDVRSATVSIVDEFLAVQEGYVEHIYHDAEESSGD